MDQQEESNGKQVRTSLAQQPKEKASSAQEVTIV